MTHKMSGHKFEVPKKKIYSSFQNSLCSSKFFRHIFVHFMERQAPESTFIQVSTDKQYLQTQYMQRIENWMEFKNSMQFASAAFYSIALNDERFPFCSFYHAFDNLHSNGFQTRSICMYIEDKFISCSCD